MTPDEARVEIHIDALARAIAQQKSPESVLSIAATPHELARALYLMGWTPPTAVRPS